jgi:hypothetical protein
LADGAPKYIPFWLMAEKCGGLNLYVRAQYTVLENSGGPPALYFHGKIVHERVLEFGFKAE